MGSDFNRELDKYLDSRTERKDWSLFKPKKQEEVPDDLKADEVRVIEREKGGFWERLFKGKGDDLATEDLSEDEMERLDSMKEELDHIDEEERAHPEMTAELEEERESLLERFFSFFRMSERRHKLERKAQELEYLQQEVVPKIDEDVKEVLRIVHRWLEKLPPKQKGAFKRSKDFARYKELLEKYGLAKADESVGRKSE